MTDAQESRLNNLGAIQSMVNLNLNDISLEGNFLSENSKQIDINFLMCADP